MPAPTVPFNVRPDGYKVRGGQDGIHATVPCLVNWSDAFAFHDQVLGFPTAPGVNQPITYTLPWKFPGAPNGKLYAVSCDIEPVGVNGQPLAGTTQGLTPGEYFKYARCAVEFETRGFVQDLSDDPGGENQLDPANPIAFCEQTVRGGGKMVSQPGKNYLYDDGSGKPLQGDVGVIVPECKLTLHYPWVPYQPWQRLQAYIGRVNTVALLGCAAGTLLFEDFESKMKATTQGLIGQDLTLSFAWQSDDWNKVPKDGSGAPTFVKRNDGSGNRIYITTDLRQIFL